MLARCGGAGEDRLGDGSRQLNRHPFRSEGAFNYIGAIGYGSGHPFDKAGCPLSITGWKEVLAKYSSK